jgi:excisionase family DNA binding protein
MNALPVPDAPWSAVDVVGPLFRPAKAAEYLGLSRSQFYEQVADGRLPRPVRIGARSSALPKSWLDAVITNRFAGGAL